MTLWVAALLAPSGCAVLETQETAGMPWGDSILTQDHVATILRSEGGFVPTGISGRSKGDAIYRLLLVPLRGAASRKTVLLLQNKPGEVVREGRGILGRKGDLIWMRITEPVAYDLRAGKVLRGEALREADPALYGRVDRGSDTIDEMPAKVSSREALRRLSAGRPDLPLAEKTLPWMEKFSKAKLVSLAPGAEPVRLTNPDSYLLTFLRKQNYLWTRILARVSEEGQVLWEADSGIDETHQILTGSTETVIRGREPQDLQNRDKWRQPFVVVVDHATGQTAKHFLRREP
jgi:hypothetical protein